MSPFGPLLLGTLDWPFLINLIVIWIQRVYITIRLIIKRQDNLFLMPLWESLEIYSILWDPKVPKTRKIPKKFQKGAKKVKKGLSLSIGRFGRAAVPVPIQSRMKRGQNWTNRVPEGRGVYTGRGRFGQIRKMTCFFDFFRLF